MRKKFYKSRTIWASIIIAIAVCYKIVMTKSITHEDIIALGLALGLYGLRNALR